MALRMCNQSVIWLRQLLYELHLDDMIDSRTIVYGDNLAANNFVKEDAISTGNQYIYLPYHWQKELYDLGHIDVLPKRSRLNLGDCFTKPVDVNVVKFLFGCLTGYQNWQHLTLDDA